ncbi:MAG TPA: DUF5658 family protein [Acidimicrobiales bacterium]
MPDSSLGPSVGEAIDLGSARRRRVELLAMTILMLNIVDLLVTQYLLRTHTGVHEGNAILAAIILSPWAWLPKVGLPLFVLFSTVRRPITRVGYAGLHVVWLIYWGVVAWNFHFLVV